MFNLERIALSLCRRKSSVFERLLSLNATAGPANEGHRESKRPKRTILTLHPSKFVSRGQKTYDISGATRLRFSFRNENDPIHVFLQKIQGRPLFPVNTRGVLYYCTNPALPPIAGEVRFRLCDTVENFEHGSDLHILGAPWSLTLMRIAYTPNFEGLRKLLVKEGLVDSQMMSDISKIPNLDKLDDRLMLFHISQPFNANLIAGELVLNLITRDAVQKVRFPNLFTDRRLGRSMSLYSGIMKARFELSDLPEHRTSGPMLVLRFLDYVTPVEPLTPAYQGGLLYPKPGHLLHRWPRLFRQPKVWTYPLNERKYGTVLKDFITTTEPGPERLELIGFPDSVINGLRQVCGFHGIQVGSEGFLVFGVVVSGR